MSYVGNSPNYQNFAIDTFNGGSASYTLTYTPGSAAAVLIHVDGVFQVPTTDYTVSATTLTPTTVWPTGTSNVVVTYLGRMADVGTPSDGTISAAKLATTAITGQTEDTAPDVAADYVLTYDASASALKKVLAARFQPVSATKQVSTSGTSIDFTSIPSWVKRIVVQFVGVSTNGISNVMIQIGDSGGIETSGYLGAVAYASNGSAIIANNFTTGFGVTGSVAAASVLHGQVVLTLQDATSQNWVSSVSLGYSNSADIAVGGGSKSLSPGPLDRLRITMVNGTDVFDAGSINIMYE
jgi:hypothetical protein